ncbi:MAG: hypothetical protein OJF59_001428 [Cytophagales bacterium]|nr:MAG: hypothetical protein OJF59_001428 [Cytophagales bacterium]
MLICGFGRSRQIGAGWFLGLGRAEVHALLFYIYFIGI